MLSSPGGSWPESHHQGSAERLHHPGSIYRFTVTNDAWPVPPPAPTPGETARPLQANPQAIVGTWVGHTEPASPAFPSQEAILRITAPLEAGKKAGIVEYADGSADFWYVGVFEPRAALTPRLWYEFSERPPTGGEPMKVLASPAGDGQLEIQWFTPRRETRRGAQVIWIPERQVARATLGQGDASAVPGRADAAAPPGGRPAPDHRRREAAQPRAEQARLDQPRQAEQHRLDRQQQQEEEQRRAELQQELAEQRRHAEELAARALQDAERQRAERQWCDENGVECAQR